MNSRTLAGMKLVNDNGNGKWGRNCDCVPRAFAIMMKEPYEKMCEFFQDQFDFHENGCLNHGVTEQDYSKKLNAEFPEHHIEQEEFPELSPTVRDFIAGHKHGRYVLRVYGHVFAVVNGAVHDCFDGFDDPMAVWGAEAYGAQIVTRMYHLTA